MDYQVEIVENYAFDQEMLLDRARQVIDHARRIGMRVIYVVVGFRDGYPEVSGRNKSFSALKDSGVFLEDAEGSGVHQMVAPDPGEIIVKKRRVGAFCETELAGVLRAGEIDSLVLLGIATGGVVLSTVRVAADLDFTVVVVSDCCSDPDEEVHRVLVEKVFVRQAHVMTSEEFLETVVQ